MAKASKKSPEEKLRVELSGLRAVHVAGLRGRSVAVAWVSWVDGGSVDGVGVLLIGCRWCRCDASPLPC